VPSSAPILVSSSLDDDNEDENPLPSTHLPTDKSIEHEPAVAPQLPRRVCSTREATGDVASDPSDRVEHFFSSNEPLLFWLKFQRLMIQKHLRKLQVI
jgi:hypothetical protein